MAKQMQTGPIAEAPNHDEVRSNAPCKDRSIGYWTSIAGQDKIDSFGGWKDSAALSSWLAQMHPDLYGFDAGPNNLWGQKNRGVAAFVQVTEMMHGPDSEACRTLAAALNEFARTCTLGQ
jgi:hypothetical protein